jgi:hypothetical protein
VPKRFFEFMSHDERVDCLCYGDWKKHACSSLLLKQGDRAGGLRVLLSGEAMVMSRVPAEGFRPQAVGSVCGFRSNHLLILENTGVSASEARIRRLPLRGFISWGAPAAGPAKGPY